MGIFRVYAGPDGESHIEELDLEQHPELKSMTNITELRVQQVQEPRVMDFHPLTERRLLIHLSGQVEIGLSDGTKHIFGPGDVRLMEDTTGRGHTHRDLGPTSTALMLLSD